MKKLKIYAILKTLIKNDVWSDTVYSFISHTHIKTGESILIGDSAVCAFNNKLFSFLELNKRFIHLKNLLEGEYYACHVSKKEYPTFADELLFIHDSISLEQVETLTPKDLGTVCTAFSGMMFICKEKMAFDASYCYYALETNALYDSNEILFYLKENSPSNKTEYMLYNLCQNHTQEGYITGADISTIIRSPVELPTFLRKVDSTHWSAQVARLLHNVPASPIIGGVVSNCSSEFIRIFELKKDTIVVGLKIQLYAQEE